MLKILFGISSSLLHLTCEENTSTAVCLLSFFWGGGGITLLEAVLINSNKINKFSNAKHVDLSP